jgi:hypothetical protein
MKTVNDFIDKHFQKMAFIMMFAIFLNTCGNPNKSVNKRLDSLTAKIDSLQAKPVVTKEDLQIEGLNAEKRMIQATDRKMLDVQRQSAIEVEINKLQKK